MRWRSVVRAVFASTIFKQAFGKLITVTEYPSSCKAIYTSGSRSVTVVRSTVIVSPTPWTDGDANHGDPFVLEIQPSSSGAMRKRIIQGSQTMWVTANGGTTTSIEDAAQYMIKGGELTSADGGFISGGANTPYEVFKLLPKVKVVNTAFSVHHGALVWRNPNFSFDNGVAQFFILSAQRQQVIVRNKGPIGINWEPVTLVARPASLTNGTSAGGYRSPTQSRTSGIGGTPASATKSGNVSPGGLCGEPSGFRCASGYCCSSFGYCGNDSLYCTNGCQPAFGICWSLSSSGNGMQSGVSATSGLVSGSPTKSISVYNSIVASSSLGGPIGPINPFSYNTATQTNMSTTGTMMASQSNAVTSSTSLPPPCPTAASDLCSASSGSTTCSSGSTPYDASCGVVYQGSVINTSNIVGLPPMRKRATEYSLADCQTLCDRYTSCIALNYIGTNCTLLSTVTGHTYVAGAVGAAVPATYVAEKTNPISPSAPMSTITSSVVTGSSPSMVKSSSAPGLLPLSSTQATTLASLSSQMTMPTSSSVTNTQGSSSIVMTLTTISEILTSSTIIPSGMSTQTSGSPSSSAVVVPSSSTVSQSTMSSSTIDSSSMVAISSSLPELSFSTSNPSINPSASTTALSSTGGSTSMPTTSSSSISSSYSAPASSTLSTTSAPATSSTATSSSASTSTVSTSINYLVIPTPTPCNFGENPPIDEDDSFCEIQLPFAMQINSQSSSNTFASTNGYISILNGSSQYSNQQFPASNIPNNTVAPFFDDLYLAANSTPQDGIFYYINNAQTTVTYEYYLNRGGNSGTVDTSETFHFTVFYDSTQPGIFTYTYYQTGGSMDNGVYAVVGIQGINSSGVEVGFTYSFQSADITPGLVVKCNTQTNTCATVQ